ncbi:MAG: galactose-1-phosphate uridylyltransferase [Protaetiibacter sp.]
MTGVTRRTARMADGRELIYFDDADSTLPAERRLDERQLDPRPATNTMRQDVLTGDWISVASGRNNRVFLPPAHLDPLAPQTPDNPSEIPDLYDVVVFENKSPSFGPESQGPLAPEGRAFDRSASAVGRCEVVCFSPESTGSLGTQSVGRIRTVIEAWADRTRELSALPGVAQVFPFENRGEAIGVTLGHPHGQIYAYPFVTPRTRSLLDAIRELGPDLFARVLEREQAGPRVVLAAEHWTAFVPFAARWPIEVHLLPHRQVPDIDALDEAERAELAVVFKRLLLGLDALYDSPTPYIAAWHQAPVREGRDEVRLMLQITSPRRGEDRLKFLAGSEAAMGAWVADIVPEDAAARLREAVASV